MIRFLIPHQVLTKGSIMMFKTILFLAFSVTSLSASAASSSARPVAAEVNDSPEIREKLSREIMEVTKSGDQIKSAMDQSSAMMMNEMPSELRDRMQTVLEKFYSWDKLETKFAKIYADVFTAKELQDIITFYKSEVGRNFINKQPDLMAKTLTMIQEINTEMKPYLMEELKKVHEKMAPETPAAN